MTLTPKQKQYLKALAHPLKPLVQVGAKGIGDSLFEQVGTQLLAHELVKIRFNTESAVEPAAVADEVATRTDSHLVQKKGRTLVLYRRREQNPTIVLPNAKASPNVKAAPNLKRPATRRLSR
ncbi:MAG TPA: ribosome assembly RNA-binding protein YhbY [Polyangiaceae bacterium]|nr:ribosome assembly RNA-binding protein YhbY [Polyangiaceae bacterium]